MNIRPQSLSLALASAILPLSLTAATVTWDGSTDMDWTAPSDATSWTGATYNDGDDAEFLGAGAGTVAITSTVSPNSVTVDSGAGVDYVFSGGDITGAATLTKNGASRLFLDAANTYTGVTTINGGQIRISNNDALGTTDGGTIIGNGTKLELAGGVTIAEPITNQGGGNGKLNSISGLNTLTGPITLDDNMDLRGSNYVFTGGFTSVSNKSVGFNGSNYTVQDTPITIGTGTFGVTSAGTNPANATRINVGGNDWGLTTINFSGYLKVGGTDYLPTDTQVRFGFNWWTRSAGILDLNGNDQTVRALGHFALGLGADNMVTGLVGDVLTINLDSASTLNTYQGRFEGGLSIVKNGDGTLILENLSSTTAPANPSSADPSPGPAVPSTNNGSFTINAGVVESRAVYGATDAITFSDTSRVIINGGTLDLNYAGTDTIGALDLGSGWEADGVYDATHPSGLITGTGSLTVDSSLLDVIWDAGTDSTWTNPDTTSWWGATYNDGDDVSFTDLGAGAVTISGTVAPSSVTVNNSAGNDYTVSGDAIGGTTGITKSGEGRFSLDNVNTFTGNVVVNGGTFAIDGAGQLESGTYAGDLTINNAGTFEYGSTATQLMTGVVGGSGSGGVVKEDSGLLDILMTATYSGPSVVNGGTLRFTNNADLSGIPTSELFINNGATLAIRSNVGGANRTVLNNKVFTFGSSGGGTINFNGGNHLFQGGNTHTFTTTGGSKNTISRTNGGFMNMQGAGTVTFNVADGPDPVDLELSVVFNNGLIDKNGAGTMAITTTTSAAGGNGGITINEGTLEVGGGATLGGGTFPWPVVNDGVFRYNSTGIQTITGDLTGSGDLVTDNTGTLILTGAISHTGAITIDGGTLEVGGGATLGGGTYADDIANSGILSFNSTANQALTGVVSGTGGLSKGNTGILSLASPHTYSGTTTINGGYIDISDAAALGTAAGGTVINSDGGNDDGLRIGGGITTAEPITIGASAGAGSITGINTGGTFTGPITLEDGGTDFRGNSLKFQGGITSAVNQSLSFNGSFYEVDTNPIDLNDGGFTVTSAGNNKANATQLNVGGNDWSLLRVNFGGYLLLGGADFLPADTAVEFGWTTTGASSGTLDLNGFDQTVASIAQTSNSLGQNGDASITGGGTLTVNLASGSVEYQGRITDGATPTALVKAGAGTQILNNLSGTPNSYTGGTTVSAGILSLGDGTNGTDLPDAGAVAVATGAVLDLNYVGTDTVAQLTLGGVSAAAGTWGATGSGATNIDDTFFTGTGTLTVTSAGSTAYDLWAAANGLVGGDALAGADVDLDALVNLLEFAFGTDPGVSDNVPLVSDGSVNGTPTVHLSGGGGGVTFGAYFVRRDDHGSSGSVNYTVQFSGDLVTFFDSGVVPTFEADSTDDPAYEVVSVPYPALLPNGQKALFFRVKVDQVP